MPPTRPRPPPFLLLLLLACQVSALPSGSHLRAGPPLADPAAPPTLPAQLQAPCAQMMDSVFEKWKLYGDQCLYNLSLLPPPTGEPHGWAPAFFPGSISWALRGRLGTGEETEPRRGPRSRKKRRWTASALGAPCPLLLGAPWA